LTIAVSRTKSKQEKVVYVLLSFIVFITLLVVAYIIVAKQSIITPGNADNLNNTTNSSNSNTSQVSDNPLAGKALYVDKNRDINLLYQKYISEVKTEEARLANKIASQPSAVWLVGPAADDPKAERDIKKVERTSLEARQTNTVPLYQLYAIPNRDACAAYSKNGFTNAKEYKEWISNILTSLKSEAIFTVEADAIAHMVREDCITKEQESLRYELINETVSLLEASDKVLGVYIDAGHSDWFKDPSEMVEPLKRAGIDKVRGISVNVSFYAPTDEITKWSQRLVDLLGGSKGVIIDTSRNGNGLPPYNSNPEVRWCNPIGRAIGNLPTTTTGQKNIDAYAWIKTVGESDGTCFGNPPAGVFVPEKALELSRNSKN
jgi:endoglucanase